MCDYKRYINRWYLKGVKEVSFRESENKKSTYTIKVFTKDDIPSNLSKEIVVN